MTLVVQLYNTIESPYSVEQRVEECRRKKKVKVVRMRLFGDVIFASCAWTVCIRQCPMFTLNTMVWYSLTYFVTILWLWNSEGEGEAMYHLMVNSTLPGSVEKIPGNKPVFPFSEEQIWENLPDYGNFVPIYYITFQCYSLGLLDKSSVVSLETRNSYCMYCTYCNRTEHFCCIIIAHDNRAQILITW